MALAAGPIARSKIGEHGRHSAVNVLQSHVRCPTPPQRSNHRLPKSYLG
jgi:hypothetical protein